MHTKGEAEVEDSSSDDSTESALRKEPWNPTPRDLGITEAAIIRSMCAITMEHRSLIFGMYGQYWREYSAATCLIARIEREEIVEGEMKETSLGGKTRRPVDEMT